MLEAAASFVVAQPVHGGVSLASGESPPGRGRSGTLFQWRRCCSLPLPHVGQAREGSARDAAAALGVDFQLARRRIEALTQYPPITRARALAAFVGAFEFADGRGVVSAASEEIAASFEISRHSWLQYRAVLVEAGLVEVDDRRGGTRRELRLLPPSDPPGGS